MKILNKLLIALAFVGLSASAVNAQTSGSCGANLTWELTGTGTNRTLTISGTGAMTNYDYGDAPWFSQRENIKTLLFPSGMTTIGNYAFFYCSGLTSVTIPNSVTAIRYAAFGSCSGLTSVTIGNSVISIGEGAFTTCSGLTSVTIPNSVTSIGVEAFALCGLISVTIGNSVTSIGERAFMGCSFLTSIDVGESNTQYSSIDGVLFNKLATTLIKYPEGKQSSSYIIPSSVTTIGNGAFQNCTSLTGALTIPNSVTTIGNSAFATCISLSSVTIPNSVTTIGNLAFVTCSGLTSVTIGNSVTTIGSQAFYGCSGLISVINYRATPQTINSGVFSPAYANATLYVLSASVSDYQAAEGWKEFNTILGSAGIDDIVSDHISIYPNPTQNELTIDGGDLQINHVEICDLAGRVVFGQPQGSPLQINVSALSVGIYLIKIHTEKGIVTRKVVKN